MYGEALVVFNQAKELLVSHGNGGLKKIYASISNYYIGKILMEKYQNGSSNFKGALEAFQKSIDEVEDRGVKYDDDIHNIMGNICKHGDETYAKNYNQAITYYIKSHETGLFPEAGFRIGELWYLIGQFDQAKNWFERSIILMSSKSIYTYSKYIGFSKLALGSILLKQQLYTDAFYAFHELLGKHCGIPEYNIGLMLKKNLISRCITNTHYEKYFIKSAKQGCSYGQHYCGLMEEKKGYYNKAMEFYKHACNQYDGRSANSIGNLYLTGNRDIEQNKEKALEYYQMGVDYGYSESKFNLALTLMTVGLRTESARALFVEYFENGASFQRYEACIKIAEIYNGINEKESMKWYQMAADHGIPEAQFKVGEYFMSQHFTGDNKYNLAYKYLKNAEKNGIRKARPLVIKLILEKNVDRKSRLQDLIYNPVVQDRPVFAGRHVTFSFRLI